MKENVNVVHFTPAQRAAIESTGIGLVMAGPGSGKTAVVVAYVVQKLTGTCPDQSRSDAQPPSQTTVAGPSVVGPGCDEPGVFDPTQVCVATFGRKACLEIKSRLAQQLDHATATRVTVVTLHAMCKLILEPFKAWIGFDARKPVHIVSSSEKSALLAQCIGQELQSLTASGQADQVLLLEQLDPAMIATEIASHKQAGREPDATNPHGPRAKVITAVYARLQDALLTRNKVEFDDLTMFALRLLTGDPDARRFVQATWPVLVLDEAQDISEVQYRVMAAALGPASQALIVGDAWQSIYAFRGALGGEVFNRFQSDHADARVLVLTHNHRNASRIMHTSEALIGATEPRQVAVTQGGVVSLVRTGSAYEEAVFITQQIAQIVETGYAAHGQIAVLCRTNEMVAGIERVMMDAKIPYTIPGSGTFFQQPEVEHMLAYLRLTQELDAHALRTIINVPDRGLSPTALATLRGHTPELLVEHIFEDSRLPDLDIDAQRGLQSVRTMLQAMAICKEYAPGDVIDFVMTELGMRKHLERGRDGDQRLERMRTLAQLAQDHRDIASYLEDLELMSGEDPLAPGAHERVQLLSLHRAKGLEFKAVFLPGVEEDTLPLRGARQTLAGMAEERRLLYVGLTRAREAVVMSYARTRGGANVQPSQFLAALGGQRLNIQRQTPVWSQVPTC